MRIAYLINQYPKVSHSFIRREILALERQGLQIARYALRGWDADVVDTEDISERQRTRFVLQHGLAHLMGSVIHALVHQPSGFLAALRLALSLARKAERPLAYHLIYLAEACQIRRWADSDGITHLHAHFGTNSAEVALLVHALGGPRFSFTVHGPEEFDKPQLLHLREKLEAAHFVVAVSSYGRSQLFRWFGHAHWHKVKVVHCGLEEAFHAIPTTPPPDVARLVCVGRLCEQKGQLLLLEALAILRARAVPCHLVLAGDGEMRPDIEASIARLGLQDCVSITGWISSADVRKVLLDARALVLPSFAEGLPVVIMEAMALQRPVISTYVAGIPELVHPGRNGWLVPAGDVEALADAMADCLASPPDALARLATQARADVLRAHDIDQEAMKLVTLFAEQT